MRDRSVTIYNYKKEDYPESDYNAILKINTSLNVNNEEDLVEALSSNSPYLLDSSNEVIINKGIVEDKTLQEFKIDFFDGFNSPTLIDYLKDDESDYRLIRLSDNTIIRPSNEDLERLDREFPPIDINLEEVHFAVIGNTKSKRMTINRLIKRLEK